MAVFYFFLSGSYLYYCKSNYFPSRLYKLTASWSPGLALAFFCIGTLLFISQQGWVSGLLMALYASSLALVLVQLTAVLGKSYFYGLVAAVHVLALIDLVY